MRRALLMIMLTNLWALDVHAAPVSTIGSDTLVRSSAFIPAYDYAGGTAASLHVLGLKAAVAHQYRADATGQGASGGAYTVSAVPAAPFAVAALARMTDPEPVTLAMVSLGFAGLLSIRRRRD